MLVTASSRSRTIPSIQVKPKELLELSEWLKENSIGLKILTLGFDTNTPADKLYFTIMASLVEMEEGIIH